MRNPRNERLSREAGKGRPGRDRAPGRRPVSVGNGVDGGRTVADEPERRCILTSERAPRDGLIRLAISPPGPDGLCQVLPDVLARAPGRGAWIGVDRAALEKAIAGNKLRGALARSFKDGALAFPADLPERIEAALTRALTDRLGLEMRAGGLLTGSDRIAESARMGRVAWLAHAADASEDGNRKLDQAWRVGNDAEGSGQCGVILPLDRAALSVALGRDNVVHLALTDPAAAERLSGLLSRLLHFLGRAPAGGPDSGQTQDDTSDVNGCAGRGDVAMHED